MRFEAFMAPRGRIAPRLFAWTGEVALAALALFVIAALEAAPAWGQSVPGHLGLACVAALAAALGVFSLWLLPAAVAGAVASDVMAFAYFRLRPFHGVWRGGGWWRAGLDVDDMTARLRGSPTAFLRAKFGTRERARLPFGAAKASMSWPAFVVLSMVASTVWAGAWLALGAAVGGATLVLPSEGDFAILAVSLVALATLVSRPAGEPA